MRRSPCLLQQHIGRLFRKNWKSEAKRVIRDNGSLAELKQRGHEVIDALDVISEKPKTKVVWPVIGYKQTATSESADHALTCYSYDDSNVLLEGIPQAKLFTNTVEIVEGELPPSVQNLVNIESGPLQDKLVQRIIKSSLLYDAYQEKLPKRTDPERPAWVFPRDYGITDRRRNLLLCNRLVELCHVSNPSLASRRLTLNDVPFQVFLTRQEGELQVLMSLRADLLVTSGTGLPAQASPTETFELPLPDMGPLLSHVSMVKKSVTKPEDIFPLKSLEAIPAKKDCVHTALVHYNDTEVANIYETEVTESQVIGRSLMKCFTFAAAQAKYNYGNDVVNPPKPVVVQCIHTDGRLFHFSVFQLNTLKEPGNDGVRNIFWSIPRIPLYETCAYVGGKPLLEGYNPDVFRYLAAFYNNV